MRTRLFLPESKRFPNPTWWPLDGGDGKDILTSGTGDDSMLGGAGADTFTFAAQNGHDTADFEQGRDRIDLTALSANNINDFGDLSIEAAGANTVITL